MRKFSFPLVCMLVVAAYTVVSAQSDEALVKSKQAVQEATLSGDVAALKAARDLAQSTAQNTVQSTAQTSPRKAVALYYVGLANYSLATRPSEKESAEQYADAGIAALEEAIKLEPNFADGHALLSSLYGRKASTGMVNGMIYGGKSSAAMQRAVGLAPNNPRVLVLQGLSLYFTPAMWGGDKQKALTTIQKACDLAEKGACVSADAALPDWGQAEGYAWKGVMFSDQEDYDSAKAAFERALQIAPTYNWVKFVLLPKLAKN